MQVKGESGSEPSDRWAHDARSKRSCAECRNRVSSHRELGSRSPFVHSLGGPHMADESQSSPHYRVNLDEQFDGEAESRGGVEETNELLRQLLIGQERQNELLEDLVDHMVSSTRQRAHELGLWKQQNPQLARKCRAAAEALARAQTEYLNTLTEEISANSEALADGDFLLNEFVDRFGPRLAHLNGVAQILSQLGSTPANSQ